MTALNLLLLDQIRTDGGTQPRTSINKGVVAEYAEAIGSGEALPKVVVFHDGTEFWLADGFHRWHGHRQAGAPEIDCDIRAGSRRDAVLFSVSANAAHGLRRSNADKHKAVQTLLSDPEWSKWSDREIAKQCNVNREMVSSDRSHLLESASEKPAERTFKTKHGTEAVMKTAAIGKANRDQASPGAAPALDDPEPTSAARTVPAPAATAPDAPADEHDDSMATQAELLVQLQAEVEQLQAQLKAATADDKAAEIVKWHKAYDHANRQFSEAQDRCKDASDREAWVMRQLRRCGKACGQDDPKNIAPAVEALCRKVKVTA